MITHTGHQVLSMPVQSSENKTDLTSFSTLEDYSFWQRISIRVTSLGLFLLIYLIGMTIRFEAIEGWEGRNSLTGETLEEALARDPVSINAFWHNRIFLMTYFWRKHRSAIIVSESFDGEYIARTAQRFGYGVVRGSSTRGGSKALKQMVRLLRQGVRMSVTIDGPRGPRYKVKSGSLLLSAKTQVPIAPMIAEAKRFWTVKSWDRLQIPVPFTRAKVFLGNPLMVDAGSAGEELAARKRALQYELEALVERGKRWRLGD